MQRKYHALNKSSHYEIQSTPNSQNKKNVGTYFPLAVSSSQNC